MQNRKTMTPEERKAKAEERKAKNRERKRAIRRAETPEQKEKRKAETHEYYLAHKTELNRKRQEQRERQNAKKRSATLTGIDPRGTEPQKRQRLNAIQPDKQMAYPPTMHVNTTRATTITNNPASRYAAAIHYNAMMTNQALFFTKVQTVALSGSELGQATLPQTQTIALGKKELGRALYTKSWEEHDDELLQIMADDEDAYLAYQINHTFDF